MELCEHGRSEHESCVTCDDREELAEEFRDELAAVKAERDSMLVRIEKLRDALTHIKKVGSNSRSTASRALEADGPDTISAFKQVSDELAALKAERERLTSGKVACADCNSILARW